MFAKRSRNAQLTRSIHYIVFQMIPVNYSPHKEWTSMAPSSMEVPENICCCW